MANDKGYVGLGLSCADVCKVLDQGMNGKRLGDLSQSVREAMNQLTTWVKPTVGRFGRLTDKTLDCRTVVEVQRKVIKQSSATLFLDSFVRRRAGTSIGTQQDSSCFSMCVQLVSFGHTTPIPQTRSETSIFKESTAYT